MDRNDETFKPIRKAELADKATMNAFADKWLSKFKSTHFLWGEFERDFGNECFSMGLTMDAGESFARKYPEAFKNQRSNPFNNSECLKKLINKIDDAEILGCAIFSRYRYFTHWSMTALTDTDIEWFVVALTRLKELTK